MCLREVIYYSSEQVEGPGEDVSMSLHGDSKSQEGLTLTHSLSHAVFVLITVFALVKNKYKRRGMN